MAIAALVQRDNIEGEPSVALKNME